MRASKKKRCIAAAIGAGMLFAGAASATPVTMNFDGINTGDQVDNYYNGGQATILGLVPDGPNGPNYGVVWSGAQTSDLTSSLSGPPAPPSGPNYITLTNSVGLFQGATMDVAAGFGSAGFSFYYFGAPTVGVYSGLDGGGSLLASQTFGTCASSSFCTSDLAFMGTAMSVVFTGPGVFDNIAFNMATKAVPEPAAAGIFGFGVVLIGLFAGLHRRMT